MGAEMLKYAADALGKISGKVDPEEILGIQQKFQFFNYGRRDIRRLLHWKVAI